MAPRQRVILGIGFGTTYSGVVWADSTAPEEIIPLRQWPAAVAKVPSEIAYKSDGTFKCGYEVATDSVRKVLQYMKLLLDASQEKNAILPDPLGLDKTRAVMPDGKQPGDVEYHLTIPAVWSEPARALTLKAANHAGIGTSQDPVL